MKRYSVKKQFVESTFDNNIGDIIFEEHEFLWDNEMIKWMLDMNDNPASPYIVKEVKRL